MDFVEIEYLPAPLFHAWEILKKIWDGRYPDCAEYNIKFFNTALRQWLLHWMSKVDNVDLLITAFPCNTRPAGNGPSANQDGLGCKDLKVLISILKNALNYYDHSHILCSAFQFRQWYCQLIKSKVEEIEDSRNGDDESSELENTYETCCWCAAITVSTFADMMYDKIYSMLSLDLCIFVCKRFSFFASTLLSCLSTSGFEVLSCWHIVYFANASSLVRIIDTRHLFTYQQWLPWKATLQLIWMYSVWQKILIYDSVAIDYVPEAVSGVWYM